MNFPDHGLHYLRSLAGDFCAVYSRAKEGYGGK